MTALRWPRPVVALGLALLVVATGCDPAGQRSDGGEPAGEVTVFAASSLTDAFGELAASFESEYPEVEVALHFGGSQTLARQIDEGAAADVFASADRSWMETVGDAGSLAGGAEVFARNRLAIAVEPGNPLAIGGLVDLADPGVVLVLTSDQVPAGRYTREALAAAAVDVTPSSLEQDVRAALSKVELGEADAAIVYASDVVAADGRVDGVEIEAEHNVAAAYPIGELAGARNPGGADAFIAFVLGEEGQRLLSAYGFDRP